MALYPVAKRLLIPPGSNDPRITPRVAILHVDAGNADSLYTYFRDRSGGIESHFFVKKDGTVEQYRDSDWQADANNLANDFAVSIETQGYGAGEWTPAQLDAIKALLLWLHQTHDIPLEPCSTWNGRGVGYHVMFGAPGPWTPVAKSCPGPDRIEQFRTVLVPWMTEATTPRVAGKTTSGPLIDHAKADLRKARRAAKGEQRRATLKAALDALRSLPTWAKR
jgi:hypothetical protein